MGIDKETHSAEYSATFTAEEQLVHKLLGANMKVKIERKEIEIENIVASKFKKVARGETLIGLSNIIAQMGVVTPVHVMTTEDSEDTYILLDGLRRLAGAVRSKLTKIDAVIWDFEDKVEGKRIAVILSLILNRSQKFSNKEMWSIVDILDKLEGVSPSDVEFVLQLMSGDYMKLKDVMLADSDFDEIKDQFLNEGISIETAYKKLVNMRKKEDRLSKDDVREAIVDEEGESVATQKTLLSLDEVNDILDLGVETSPTDTLDNLDMTKDVRGDVVQSTDDRKPIDPAIKQGTLLRDNFACRCCGIGHGAEWLGVLVYHHLLPVFVGGPDTVENGLTLCANCHLTLHNYINGRLVLDLKSLDDKNKEIFKNILRYGNVAIKAAKQVGMKKDAFTKADAPSRRHLMPGENLPVNNSAFQVAKQLGKVGQSGKVGGEE